MTSYEIRPASIRDIRPLTKGLRAAGAISLQAFGFEPRRALHRAFMASFHCRTAVMDGQPAAMWGLVGPLLGDEATVWLALSDKIQTLPVSIVKEARAELNRYAEDYEIIGACVLPDDEAALRFALHLGFYGQTDDTDLTREQHRKAIMADEKNRVPIGDSYVIWLNFHRGTVH